MISFSCDESKLESTK